MSFPSNDDDAVGRAIATPRQELFASPEHQGHQEYGDREEDQLVQAYVFIQTRVGMGPRVVREVGRIRGVLSSEGVTGPYDGIAYAEGPELDDVGRLVATQIHAVDGIVRTVTCIRTGSP